MRALVCDFAVFIEIVNLSFDCVAYLSIYITLELIHTLQILYLRVVAVELVIYVLESP